MSKLYDLLTYPALQFADRTAIISPSENINRTYSELFANINSLASCILNLGLKKQDRTLIYLNKSIIKIESIFSILKLDAVYIPIDENAPFSRNINIILDSQPKVIITESQFLDYLLNQKYFTFNLSSLSENISILHTIEYHDRKTVAYESKDLSHIIYTSGSTGIPKGVVHTNFSTIKFLDWCSNEFKPNFNDVFSSHAPFHFDLSIIDIFLTIKHGASVVLFNNKESKNPMLYSSYIERYKISIWYSTPSVLKLFNQFGKLTNYDLTSLRMILFAGEVYPLKQLIDLMNNLHELEYYNLYGPTETNVCTFFKLPKLDKLLQYKSLPIGKKCSHFFSDIFSFEESVKIEKNIGELCISGDGLMDGYWNLPSKNKEVFFEKNKTKWYKTGDIVSIDENNDYIYRGRDDRMIKKNGYRIELGDIESALNNHENINEVSVIFINEKIICFISLIKNTEIENILSFTRNHLPEFMIPDKIIKLDELPKTSTHKIDLDKLKQISI